MKKIISGRKYFIIILFLSVLLYLGDQVFLKSSFLSGDYRSQHVPWAIALDRAVKDLSLPLWDIYTHSGFPLLAEGQVAALYPANLFFYMLFPVDIAYAWSNVFHYLLAFLFMYLFLSNAGLDDFAASAGALFFSFGSASGGGYYNTISLKVLCWFPLTLYLTDKYFSAKKMYFLLIIGVVFAQQVLAGYFQYAFYSIVVTVLYYYYVSFVEGRSRLVKSICKDTARLFLSAATALIIAAPQIYESLKLINLCSRGDRDIYFALWGSFNPCGAATLFFPHLGWITFGAVFIGVVPLSMTFFIKRNVVNRQLKFMLFLFCCSLVFALGRYSPAYRFILNTVKFYGFRVPAKFLFFSGVSLSVIAAYGIHSLLKNRDDRDFLKKRFFIWVVAAILVVCLLGTANIALEHKEFWLEKGREYVINNVYGKMHHKHSLDEYMARLEPIYDSIKSAVYLRNPFILTGVFSVIISLALLYLYSRFSVKNGIFIAAFLFVSMCELLVFNNRCKIKTNMESLGTFKAESQIADFIGRDKGLFRIYEFVESGIGNTEEIFEVLPNRSIIYRLYDIGCYTPLVMKDYYDFIGRLGSVDDSTGAAIPDKKALRDDLNLLRMLNVKYVLSVDEIPFLDHVADFDGCGIYKLKGSHGRFSVTDKIVFSEGDRIRENIIRLAGTAEKPFVYVENGNECDIDLKNLKSYKSKIEVKKYAAGSVVLNVFNEPGSAVLATSELYYPGWKLFVNGKRGEFLKINSVFRGVLLPKGQTKIEMFYRPYIFYILGIISFLGYLFCIGFCVSCERGIKQSLIWVSCVFAVCVFIVFFCVFIYSQAAGKL
ncbi:MAG: YfhO family protein [bacterium]|nr:YfhO family protein [bacterium]